jgi:Response regulators consisting of a CheY-like receiver domain and a winged-helix DNA-binding domain
MMPEMDGVEAARRIRALGRSFEKLPIVALTANAIEGTREMMLASGIDDFLSKPIIKEELEAVLARWIPAEFKSGGDFSAESPGPEPGPPPAGTNQVIPSESGPDSPQTFDYYERLAAGGEFDPRAGLASVENEALVYDEMLKLFQENIAALVDLMAGQLERADLRGLSIQVHGLKSSLASLGARELSEKARELEEAGLAEDLDFCRNKLPDFLRRLRAVARLLDDIFGPADPGSPTETDSAPPVAGPDFEPLGRALAVYDFEAIHSALAELMSRPHGPTIDQALADIKKRLRLFDYEGAAELLEKLR